MSFSFDSSTTTSPCIGCSLRRCKRLCRRMENFPLIHCHRLHKMFQVELNEVTLVINHLYPTSETETADEGKAWKTLQKSLISSEWSFSEREWIYDGDWYRRGILAGAQLKLTFKGYKISTWPFSLKLSEKKSSARQTIPAINLISFKYTNTNRAPLEMEK